MSADMSDTEHRTWVLRNIVLAIEEALEPLGGMSRGDALNFLEKLTATINARRDALAAETPDRRKA
jgi:hypothetical protein